MRAKTVCLSACLALVAVGCGTSKDQVVASRAGTQTVQAQVDEDCETTTAVSPDTVVPWRGTAPPHIPRGNGNLPSKPSPSLGADETAAAAGIAEADALVGPVVGKAELFRAVPWNAHTGSKSLVTKSVGSLLYYRFADPADIPMALGSPADLGGESGWRTGEDGLPLLEPSKVDVYPGARVVGVYVLDSTNQVYVVEPFDYMPATAC